MSEFRCSGYTAKLVQCTNTTPALWKGVIALCVTHRASHGNHVRAIKERAVAKYAQDQREQREKFEQLRLLADSKVYFVQADDVIKIGFTTNMVSRLSNIRAGSGKKPLGLDPAKAVLLASIPGGRVLEREMHTKFHHLRVTGEWFSASPELIEYIKEVAA